jgi:hypothetical protein
MMCEFIKNGVPINKEFRLKELEVVINFYGREVDSWKIYNHLRHWIARWVHMSST